MQGWIEGFFGFEDAEGDLQKLAHQKCMGSKSVWGQFSHSNRLEWDIKGDRFIFPNAVADVDLFVGQQWGDAGDARRRYIEGVRNLDPTDSAGRTVFGKINLSPFFFLTGFSTASLYVKRSTDNERAVGRVSVFA
ncbi:hypothetical protein [Methylocaldum gracile]|uniref:hypothetical protein n=1 Tax=Methylocaldum sp. 0917 TaxID=2485163 RepID=UPI0010CE042F